MQDVVNFESKYARIVLQERFGDGSVPKPFFLFVSGGISGVSRVIDIAFDLKVVRKVERCGDSAAVIERMQIVLSLDEACLWTDGRYYIQAEKQLKGSEVKLFKQGNLGVPTYQEYIISKLAENSKIGIDAKILLSSDINEILSKKKYKIEIGRAHV